MFIFKGIKVSSQVCRRALNSQSIQQLKEKQAFGLGMRRFKISDRKLSIFLEKSLKAKL